MPEFGLYDVAGLIGSAIVIIAYFATQAGWFSANDPRFAWANLIGAALIIMSLTMDWNLAAFVMEIFWILISIFGLVRYYAHR
jgi:purine-cytosine permease-like protein